jgi:N-acetylmuramoyl-L-alanine amidase
MTQLEIVIDVGHGGTDSGAVSSINKLIEKELNLKVALKVRDMLESQNFMVYMTRTNDKTFEINDRCKYINSLKLNPKNVIGISIHHNAYNSTANGAETIYSIKTKESKRIAELIGAEFGKLNKLRRVFSRLNSRNTDYYGILRDIEIPMTIVEYAFLDNAKDAQLINTDAGLEIEARAIVQGILNYYGLKYVDAKSKVDIDSSHWVMADYNYLNDLGIDIHDKRFNESMTRAEVIALISRVIRHIKKE